MNVVQALYYYIFVGFVYICFSGCSATNPDIADTIYHNGTILTMVDDMPDVEAIAVSEGMIIATGSLFEIEKFKGDSTIIKDLQGRTMLPGFIDAHSHITMAMNTIRWADLNAPPVGAVRSIDDLIQVLTDYKVDRKVSPGDWILGWGYDPDQLAEQRHPTRLELSAAFPDHPVFLLHVSAHMAVANDAALSIAKVTAESPDPAGGLIVREPNSKMPNGLLQEKAMYLVLPLLPSPGPEEMVQLLEETQDYYASFGITTAQDGLTDIVTYQFLKQIAQLDNLKIDIEALASFNDAEAFFEKYPFGERTNRLRLAGLKVVSDGSPQGKTAYFRDPYLTEVPGCMHSCRGFPTIQPEELSSLMAHCYANNIQLYVHANGDASIEMLLNTHLTVTDSLNIDQEVNRTVVIHSQFAGRDQLERYKEYNFVPSFFSNHAFFWGDVHHANLGEDRASFLSPLKSAADLGIIATNHTDFTITPINQMFLLWTAVNRTTRTGKILGPEERITPWEGLKAITINSAYQHQLEKEKGSLEIGKVADFVILDQNPLDVLPQNLKDVKVIETIKEGKSIYSFF